MSSDTPQHDPQAPQPQSDQPQGGELSSTYPEAPRTGPGRFSQRAQQEQAGQQPVQPTAPEPAQPQPQWHYADDRFAPERGDERVGAGLLSAFAAVLVGLVLTVVVWRLGFIASITSFVMAAGAVFLYSRGAGRAPRRGLGPLIALIVVGVLASFFAVIASDAWDYYTQNAPADAAVTRVEFVTQTMFDGEVIKGYGKEIAMFALFAVLGVAGTLRRLVSTPA